MVGFYPAWKDPWLKVKKFPECSGKESGKEIVLCAGRVGKPA